MMIFIIFQFLIFIPFLCLIYLNYFIALIWQKILYCINHSCLNLQMPFFICIEVGVFMKSQLKFYYDTLLCHEDFFLFVILLGLMREDTSLKIINIYNYLLLFGFQFKSSHSRCSLLMLLRLLQEILCEEFYRLRIF